MKRRTFQILGAALVCILIAAAITMANMNANEAAIGLSCSAGFTALVVYFLSRLLDA